MQNYVTESVLKNAYKPRHTWGHKGNYGKLLCIMGSYRHTGSAIFAGLAAARAGCDLVYIAAPERAADAAARFSPSLITEPLQGTRLQPKHISKILNFAAEVRATAVAIGPGLWREGDTFTAIRRLISAIDVPMVIDADAIRSLAGHCQLLQGKHALLTPHADELRAFSGKNVAADLSERISAVKDAALESGATILLKGHIDVLSDGKRITLNKTGSSYMTKGGMGDTLTGIAGAMLARGVDMWTAGMAAVWINGKAGELASQEKIEGVLPIDLIDKIPIVIRK
jgi:NAD(P)H-hydrate epimerase